MTDDFNRQQPFRPPIRGINHYRASSSGITARPKAMPPAPIAANEEVFTLAFIASKAKGGPMDEREFLINLIFKPKDSTLRLRPAETQLLLAVAGEILKEIEEEELLILKNEQLDHKQELT
jgi:hypothetical protein